MNHFDKPDRIVLRACALAFCALLVIACGGGDPELPTERPILLPGGGMVKK
jgi:hypothetical protein